MIYATKIRFKMKIEKMRHFFDAFLSLYSLLCRLMHDYNPGVCHIAVMDDLQCVDTATER